MRLVRTDTCSELSSPLSAISSILAPSLIHSPSPSLVSTSIQAVSKIFGQYAASISQSWSSESHVEAKNLVSSIQSGLAVFTTSSDIEIQERAVEALQLLGFVDADLTSHVPPARTAKGSSDDIPGMEGGFESNNEGQPSYPKSLFLFQPLFTTHELNAVAYKAQDAVRIPEGLNLDQDIVPGGGFGDLPSEDLESEEEEQGLDLGEGGGAGMDELRRVLREQDGKDKKKGRRKGKEKKVEGEVISPEEKAEKARVCCHLHLMIKADGPQRKAAKKAKAQEDPYYLYDEKDADEDDVDDIPIVRLDDLPTGKSADRCSGARADETR
jgi:AP-3 complex subunit delta-1